MRINAHSRLRFSKSISVDGVAFWDLPEYPQLPPQPDDMSYVVVDGDRLSWLAQRFYGHEQLKWVLCVANELVIEPTDLKEGMTLRVPSPRWVRSELPKLVKY